MRRTQEGERLANGFFWAVPIEPFRGPVPARDDPLQGLANNRVIRGINNRRQALAGFFTPFALRDVAGEAACMDELALLPQHVGVDQDMLDRPILADQPRLVVLEL